MDVCVSQYARVAYSPWLIYCPLLLYYRCSRRNTQYKTPTIRNGATGNATLNGNRQHVPLSLLKSATGILHTGHFRSPRATCLLNFKSIAKTVIQLFTSLGKKMMRVPNRNKSVSLSTTPLLFIANASIVSVMSV